MKRCLIIACLILPAGVVVGNDNAAQIARNAVDQALEEKAEEPVVARIALEPDTVTAFKFVQLIEMAIEKKENSPMVVAVPAAVLNNIPIRKKIDLKDVPLSEAMAALADSTPKLQISKRADVWWVEERPADPLTRSYKLSPDDLRGLGLEYAAVGKPNEVHLLSRIGGKSWPGDGEASAGYFPSSGGVLMVRMERVKLAEFDALLLLRRAGYEKLEVK